MDPVASNSSCHVASVSAWFQCGRAIRPCRLRYSPNGCRTVASLRRLTCEFAVRSHVRSSPNGKSREFQDDCCRRITSRRYKRLAKDGGRSIFDRCADQRASSSGDKSHRILSVSRRWFLGAPLLVAIMASLPRRSSTRSRRVFVTKYARFTRRFVVL